MTAIDRPRTTVFASGNRQLHSTRPDLIRKITVLRQRLAALEGALASSAQNESPNAGGPQEPSKPETAPFGFADDAPSPRLRSGAGMDRLRRG
jgi:hypothetical protein